MCVVCEFLAVFFLDVCLCVDPRDSFSPLQGPNYNIFSKIHIQYTHTHMHMSSSVPYQ